MTSLGLVQCGSSRARHNNIIMTCQEQPPEYPIHIELSVRTGTRNGKYSANLRDRTALIHLNPAESLGEDYRRCCLSLHDGGWVGAVL